MPALKPKTRILYKCPETGATLKGYVRSANPHGADLTVIDPRYKEPASKDAVALDPDGAAGTFKLDPEIVVEDKKPAEIAADAIKQRDDRINVLEIENAKFKAWIDKKMAKEDKKPQPDDSKSEKGTTPTKQ